ncbi:MAG: N-acetylglutaminylglutamine amidotransferase, partial [Pseudomonadota bacterium]|nr:N-acetylglutaminylglutamine amidotransferase [Pseudomonadota bacterium]
MCGLCGEIRFDNQYPSAMAIERMNDIMIPRGPDGVGSFQMNHLAFGQRRLKIIDLSDHAHQPMIDNLLGLGIVYNGAIYNYPELRQTLMARGYQFFSSGDTEVILKAYAEWGAEFIHHLHGMFAFALWERDSGRVLLARDRLGIKPLYYAPLPHGLRFASSLPALVAAGGINTEIDPLALHYYMSFHAVVPAPHTLLQGVRKLPPATLMFIEADGSQKQQQYWHLNFETPAEEAKLSLVEWQERILT